MASKGTDLQAWENRRRAAYWLIGGSTIAAAGPAVAGPRIPQVVPGGQAGDLPAVAVPGLGIRCDLRLAGRHGRRGSGHE
jgi:hypothetical protein